jgi:hypothetical protein
LDSVCNLPSGPGVLGEPCVDGSTCRSGICLTTTRSVGCTASAGCDSDETCECADGSAPPCAGGAVPACVSRACDALCETVVDCQSSFGGNRLTLCDSTVTFTLPDQSQVIVSACTRGP